MRGLLLPIMVSLILAVPLLWRLPGDLEPSPLPSLSSEALLSPAAGPLPEAEPAAQLAVAPEEPLPLPPSTQPER